MAAPLLLARPTGSFTWEYRYRNRLRDEVELWVSLPRVRPGQRDLVLATAGASPRELLALDVRGEARRLDVAPAEAAATEHDEETVNLIARYRLRPGEEAGLRATFRGEALRLARPAEADALLAQGWSPAPPGAPLPPAARAFYLRSTPLAFHDARTIAAAEDAARGEPVAEVGEGAGYLSRLAALAAHLISDRYRYRYPSPAFGSEGFAREREGDCGGYTLLLVAYARSLGIPARAVFGSWAAGSGQGHVWSEAYLEGVGWVPVDASVAAALRRDRAHLDSLLRFPPGFDGRERPGRYVGGHEGQRIAFSLEANPHPLPGFREEAHPPPSAVTLEMPGQRVAWGFGLLDGTVPYLQPAYPRFHGPLPRWAGDSLLLGRWGFREGRLAGMLRPAQGLALALGVVLLLLLHFGEWDAAVAEVLRATGLASLVFYAATRIAGALRPSAAAPTG